MDRKYRQQGYQDAGQEKRERRRSESTVSRTGPRSPRMAGFHEVMRCAICGVTLPRSFTEINASSQCPECSADLHSCKNCVFFDPASRFECAQPVRERIAPKDVRNNCDYFEARTTVEKQTGSASERRQDPRAAFESLFKK